MEHRVDVMNNPDRAREEAERMLGAAKHADLPVEVTVKPVYIADGQRGARKCWGIFVITQTPDPREAGNAAKPVETLAFSETPSAARSHPNYWTRPWAWAFGRVAGRAAA